MPAHPFLHFSSVRRAEINCYCELYACNVNADVLEKKDLRGIILSGGPSSVYEEGAPHVLDSVWALIAARTYRASVLLLLASHR